MELIKLGAGLFYKRENGIKGFLGAVLTLIIAYILRIPIFIALSIMFIFFGINVDERIVPSQDSFTPDDIGTLAVILTIPLALYIGGYIYKSYITK